MDEPGPGQVSRFLQSSGKCRAEKLANAAFLLRKFLFLDILEQEFADFTISATHP